MALKYIPRAVKGPVQHLCSLSSKAGEDSTRYKDICELKNNCKAQEGMRGYAAACFDLQQVRANVDTSLWQELVVFSLISPKIVN